MRWVQYPTSALGEECWLLVMEGRGAVAQIRGQGQHWGVALGRVSADNFPRRQFPVTWASLDLAKAEAERSFWHQMAKDVEAAIERGPERDHERWE